MSGSAPTATTIIGSPKSHAGERNIPLGPMVVNTLREWWFACPRGDLDLIFPTATGQIEHHSNVLRALAPIMIEVGLTYRATYFLAGMTAANWPPQRGLYWPEGADATQTRHGGKLFNKSNAARLTVN